jgi:hypothetical protein
VGAVRTASTPVAEESGGMVYQCRIVDDEQALDVLLADPVEIQNLVARLDQRFQAAGSYWLMRPPRMGRHRILP